jgi:hypothetical protein
MYLLLMIGFQTFCILLAGGVWAIPKPLPEEGVAFKLMRANKPVVDVIPGSHLPKRQTGTASGNPSALGDISDDCMPTDYLT